MSKAQIIEDVKRKVEEVYKNEGVEEIKQRNFDLKNYDEVETYLKNLHIEFSFQCYGEKQPDGCYRLANYYENVKNDYEEATALHKQNCDQNKYERSCYQYAVARATGRGMYRTNESTLELEHLQN
jgi:hypothetical protein